MDKSTNKSKGGSQTVSGFNNYEPNGVEEDIQSVPITFTQILLMTDFHENSSLQLCMIEILVPDQRSGHNSGKIASARSHTCLSHL